MTLPRLALRTAAALAAFAAAATASARPARASLKVVASIPVLGSIAREVGGDRVDVQSLAKGYQDPHFVEAKPNLMLVLNRADLLLHVGLELEIGWLPPLILGSRNPRIQTGEPGNLDCSQAIPLLDVPRVKVDRSMGDIHPQGNPHYWLPPANAKRLAEEIERRLAQLDPDGRAEFERRLATFEQRVDAKAKELSPSLQKLRGARIATYHKSWTYVSQWIGLEEVGYVENKPGIPPDPNHLVQLIAAMKRSGVKVLLMEDFYNKRTAQLVAEKAGARLVVLPTDVAATPEVKDWFTLIDVVVKELAAGIAS
ncbi:MAG: zinc ABC transporter substrate-binding protein [Myxococcales bacterium]